MNFCDLSDYGQFHENVYLHNVDIFGNFENIRFRAENKFWKKVDFYDIEGIIYNFYSDLVWQRRLMIIEG